MKKCPFCAEEIKNDAIICKHCQKDLTTKEAQKLIKKLGKKSFWETAQEETKKQEQAKKQREEYLKTLPPEERKKEELKDERKKWLKRLWWTAGILGGAAFFSNAYWAIPIFLLAIFLHPTKQESKPSLHLPFKDWKKYWLRGLLSFFVIVLCLGQAAQQADIRQAELEKQEYEEFLQNYPTPQIQVSSSREYQESNKDYLLRFSVTDSTTVLVNGEEVEGSNGDYSIDIPLENMTTKIHILAKNDHKESQETLVIERGETTVEKEARIAREEEEKRKKEASERQAQEKKNQETIDMLQREIESIQSFDSSGYRENVTSIQMETVLFGAWAVMINEGKQNDNTEIQSLASNLESKVKNLQMSEFPKMRKAYGELVADLLWEENIEVRILGSANTTIELTGGVFADNGNIKDVQEMINDILVLLRFDKAHYRWYEYDEGFSYTIESLNDNEMKPIAE